MVADSQHTTTLAPKQSPNVPTAVNAQAQEDSELQIVRVDDNNDRFRYYPGDVEWQQRKCRELRLEYRGPNGVEPGSIDTLLTNPTGFKSICCGARGGYSRGGGARGGVAAAEHWTCKGTE